MYPPECSGLRCIDISQIWLHVSLTLTQDKEITQTTRRRGEMLVVTQLGVSYFLLSLCSIEMLSWLMVEASFCRRTRARGESVLDPDSKANPEFCAYHVSHSALTRNRHLVSKPFVIGRPMRGEQTGLTSLVSRSVVYGATKPQHSMVTYPVGISPE